MYCPPNYSDLSSSSISVPGTVHDLLSNNRSYSVQDWLQTLIRTAASDQTTSPLTYRVISLKHYKCRWDGVQHECLLVVICQWVQRSPAADTPSTTSDPFADVSDDPPAPNIPRFSEKEYYVRVSRSIAASGFLSRVGVIHRNALDVITVTPDCQIDEPMIPSLWWPQPTSVLPLGTPDLVGISKIISFVSNIQPKDSISSPQCRHFFTLAIGGDARTIGWHCASSIKNTETIFALLRTAQRHEEVAAKVLAEADKDTERGGGLGGAVSDPSPSDSTPLITL
ncbi:hypothetical protein BU15DRAFT_65650 [Melanogaster broomeanus]|nr:hypothetical protein BU15DRAFT_65650 [Melanogaster broomeanus]